MFAKHRGFTLIELLVVISIIALLVGILLPALGAARRTAQNILCGSQMRQLATAAQTYCMDNNGYFCSIYYDTKPGDNPDPNLSNGMRDYIGIPDYAAQPGLADEDTIMTCPIVQDLYPTKVDGHRNYGMNYMASSRIDPHRDMVLRIDLVKETSSMMHFGDGAKYSYDEIKGNFFLTYHRPNQYDKVYYPHQGAQQYIYLDLHYSKVNEEEVRDLELDVWDRKSKGAAFWWGGAWD